MKTIFTSILLLFSALFSACQQKGSGFESLSVDDFATLLADPAVQCVDVRTVAEYSEGHIPASININVLDKSFEAMADSTLQKDKPVAVYCRSGKRSKKAAELLSKKGFQVFELSKGFNGWQEAGKGVEK